LFYYSGFQASCHIAPPQGCSAILEAVMLVLLMGGFYEAVEVRLDAMTYIPSFIKVGSVIQKLLSGMHIETHRQQGDFTNLLLVFKIRKVG
jgi:hypothetical protein